VRLLREQLAQVLIVIDVEAQEDADVTHGRWLRY
jgi:hypothetical protein